MLVFHLFVDILWGTVGSRIDFTKFEAIPLLIMCLRRQLIQGFFI